MKSLNPSPESLRRNGVIGLGLIPGHGLAVTSIKVSHGHNQFEVAVPSNSSFGTKFWNLRFVINGFLFLTLNLTI